MDSRRHIYGDHVSGSRLIHHLYNLPAFAFHVPGQSHAEHGIDEDIAPPRQKILPFHQLHLQIFRYLFLDAELFRHPRLLSGQDHRHLIPFDMEHPGCGNPVCAIVSSAADCPDADTVSGGG